MLLAMFQELYDIEDRAKTLTPPDRQQLRHAEARPIWMRMQEYLGNEAVSNVMPKEPFGQALTYLRNQFDHLLVYLDDGLMPIDNNGTEQLMKQVALGRKNWMFIGRVAPDSVLVRLVLARRLGNTVGPLQVHLPHFRTSGRVSGKAS